MEPWLDSLSEDWCSEKRSSSPAPSVTSRRFASSTRSNGSQTRIPHLARSLRKDASSTGSFLRPRSSRGIARSKGEPILSERSASSLNLPAAPVENKKRHVSISGSRHVSSAFSESQNSVQHYTIDERAKNDEYTPEWKKRLAKNENVKGGTVDLFAPSQLEGMFSQPTKSVRIGDVKVIGTQSQPWTSLKEPVTQRTTDLYQSLRGSRNQLPAMEVLQEEDEDDDLPVDLSAITSDLARNGSLKGLVRQRVQHLEEVSFRDSIRSLPADLSIHKVSTSRKSTDPRWRTISGQEELRNEIISPVTSSKQNTIREKVLSESLDFDVENLRERLSTAPTGHLVRPSSSSSDRDISYGPPERRISAGREHFPDLTSQSLPEDLSMGTEDFVSHGGFVNQRRGGHSNEASFLHRPLSPSPEKSFNISDMRPMIHIHSSPPPFRSTTPSRDQSRVSLSLPTTPKDTSIIHHELDEPRATSLSPLKLFGDRDTYTNKKLMRILSHFEDPEDDMAKKDQPRNEEEPHATNHRMSQFGGGELDGFTFEQEIVLPEAEDGVVPQEVDKIFISTKISSPQAPLKTKPVLETDVVVSMKDYHPHIADGKDRIIKRRRTLVDGMVNADQQKPSSEMVLPQPIPQTIGKKRKETYHNAEGSVADPGTLASRALLEPKVVRRNSVGIKQTDAQQLTIEPTALPRIDEHLTEALAAELATFAQEVVEVQNDSRKASLATRDYMEEANKVMQFIRARGKPTTPRLPEIQEPANTSELEPDAILDLDIDDDESTKDQFSRPPSREGKAKAVPDRRQSKHDSETANYLRQYEDHDDFDQLNGASARGTLPSIAPATDHQTRRQSVDDQKSDPPNIRISNLDDTQRKRKYSSSTIDGPASQPGSKQEPTAHLSNDSSRRTFLTNSSGNGNRGVITSGTVSIPDKVGTMTFDHQRKVWVKTVPGQSPMADRKRPGRQTTSDEDPFKDIPDLSVDETHEERLPSNPTDADQDIKSVNQTAVKNKIEQKLNESLLERSLYEELDHEPVQDEHAENEYSSDDHRGSIKSEASRHEARLLDGIPSRPPTSAETPNKQARVVTIAFSSPVVSAIQYPEESSMSDDDLDEESFLPLDDSGMTMTPARPTPKVKSTKAIEQITRSSTIVPKDRHEKYRAMTMTRRPPSRIEEHDEIEHQVEMSLVRVPSPGELESASYQTPGKEMQIAKTGNSIICLTPLSEFTLHQVDNVRHPDESYVEERPGPQSLRHAHGAHALAVDALVEAITDAVTTEAYWDQLRSFQLNEKQLTTLHGLKVYCSSLEKLDASGNAISELAGLPQTLRSLDLHANMLTNLTSWGHLHNLQYVDVSRNQLESLEGMASLVHLRSLKANHNNLQDIRGILELDGLLELEISDNALISLDFQGSHLPRLQRIDAGHNCVDIVRNLALLPQLQELSLAHNSLSTFEPDPTLPIVSLRDLNLSHNNLVEVKLQPLPNLQQLNLDNNKIQRVWGLEGARSLQELSLEHQSQSLDIVSTILSTSNDCHRIRLSWNSLPGGIPALPERPQYNLCELEIAGCGIAGLPEGFGDFFPNCRRLDLNFNAIRSLSCLQGMMNLERLSVSRNRIQRMRRTCLVLSRLRSISSVDLRDNPLTLGFYSPTNSQTPLIENAQKMAVAPINVADESWIVALDETTRLKRNMMRLLLAEICPHLLELDGLPFDREQIQQEQQIFDSLRDNGVLALPLVPVHMSPAVLHKSRKLEGPVGVELAANNPWDIHDPFGAQAGNDNYDLMTLNGLRGDRNLLRRVNDQEAMSAASTMTLSLSSLAVQ